jgi:hypothetical protein
MRSHVHVAGTGEMKNAQKINLESLKGEEYLENQSIDRRIILQWDVRKMGGK